MSGINRGPPQRDWRKGKKGRTEKLAYILENKEFTDLTFRVGRPPNVELISAHRTILSMYSSVFERMFHGPLAPSNDEIIEVVDIEPKAFHVILKFIYSGEFEKSLGTDLALSVLYGAKKYDISELEMVSTQYLISNKVNIENAVNVFQTAQLLDVPRLRDDACSFITRNFDEICKHDEFINLTLDNLVMFLKNDQTRGVELELFQSVKKWAEAESIRQNLEPTSANLRKVAYRALMQIRFPIMTSEEFALHVIPTEMLTSEESTLLFQHMVVPLENRYLLQKLSFSSQKRISSLYYAKFYESISLTPYVDISAGWFNKFSVSEKVSIVSYGFYGPHSVASASYNIVIKLLQDSDEEVLAEFSTEIVAKMREIFYVSFPKPVTIFPGSTYRAWFSLKGPLTCHGTSSNTMQDIKVPVAHSKYNHVKFNYHVTGAHQCPSIAFQI